MLSNQIIPAGIIAGETRSWMGRTGANVAA